VDVRDSRLRRANFDGSGAEMFFITGAQRAARVCARRETHLPTPDDGGFAFSVRRRRSEVKSR
jgi:hypothetical protein